MEHIQNYYNNYMEENRLTTDNARKVEYLTTVDLLKRRLPEKSTVLDCAAGTGVYAFYLGDNDHNVTALDLIPKHINYIHSQLALKPYAMETAVNDARDLSLLEDGSFDAVLCMGPLYHLTSRADREKCLSECIRVLRPGGLLFAAYISRFAIFPNVLWNQKEFCRKSLIDKILDTGAISSDDPDCFWTDTYYYSPGEIEEALSAHQLTTIDHIAADGLTPFLREQINALSVEEFEAWMHYHLSTCREPSVLGTSIHGMIVGRK